MIVQKFWVKLDIPNLILDLKITKKGFRSEERRVGKEC